MDECVRHANYVHNIFYIFLRILCLFCLESDMLDLCMCIRLYV